MSSSRFSGLNILLLVVTVLSLMFGVYGFVAGGIDNSNQKANRVEIGELGPEFEGEGSAGESPLAAESKDSDGTPRKTHTSNAGGKETTSNKTQPNDTTVGPALPEVEAKSQPTDKGDATIQGSVIGPDGTPVSNAVVSAVRSDLDVEPPKYQDGDIDRYRDEVTSFLQKTARETRSTSTDESGKFSFSGLDPLLAYDISARADPAGTGEQERVAAGDNVVLLLSPESLLRGRVETADGKPVKKFSVKAWRQNRQWEATSRNFEDEEGKFSMPGRNGTMQVEVSATGFTQGDPKQVEVGPDAEEVVIVLDQAAILSGVVTDKDGNPLGEVQVRIGGAQQDRNGWNQPQNNSARTHTDSKGRYRFDTLPPKEEETKVTAELGEMSDTQSVVLHKGENKLDFSMDIGAVIKLRLSDPDGKPVEPDNVWFQQKGGRNWPRPDRLPAKEPGLAEYAGLPPGEYTMTVTSAGYPVIKQDIEVTAGGNDYKLSFTKGAMLTGKIASSSGSKVSNVSVRLRKDGEQGWGGWGGGSYAQIQEDGSYKLGPAEPGQWNIEVYTTGGGWTKVYEDIVSLAEGDNTHNITVDAGASVIVKLLDEEGNPLSWGNVQLQSDQGGKNYNGRSDGEGLATISFVEVGSYRLVANARGKAAPSQFVSLRAGDNNFTLRLQAPNACRITYVYPDSQASKAGFEVGDIITEYNGTTVTSWRQLGQLIRKTKADQDVTVSIDHRGSMLTIDIKGGTVGIEGADAVR
ncbi:MAG: carboxypeptidase regulatory-like domain-containing protein [Planctomycetes bacterium]|nr:carboxypeptidase regulatory-like domain-containing protein [Planctomycetota bacterium]